MQNLAALFLTALALGAPSTARAQDATFFPFVLPWDDATHTITDVSFLNPVPAGGGGFVKARGGHFYDEKGKRIRFIGTNFAFSADFPNKEDAEKIAARLHKFGFNIVRMHHMDNQFAPNGIWDPAFKDKQHIDKDQMDRLDYLIYQFKLHGIYTNFNLHVSRGFSEADGFAEADKLPEMSKYINFFETRMIQLQKNYARDLLTHVNPYTKTAYVDEPSVAVVEINNENTLLGEAWGSNLENLAPTYKKELTGQWNTWLKKKYANTESLKRAWSSADKPFGPNLLQNADFARGAERWTLELNQAPASAKMSLPDDVPPPAGAQGKVVRVTVQQLGARNWHIQMHQSGLDLTEGEPYTATFWAKADHDLPIGANARIDHDDWHGIGLDKRVDITTQWRKYDVSFTASRTDKDHNRFGFVLGNALGTIDIAGLMLRPGVETSLPAGVSLEQNNIPMERPVANPSGLDWISFLVDTEHDYMQGMRDYLKNDLKVHANVTGSQDSYGGFGGALRESMMDFADNHAYWQHPEFPHKPWDSVDWRIPNTSMVRASNGGELPGLARFRLANKPYTISEYNHPAPNDYQAECVPMLAAFAAVQDWDGFYLFDYNGDRNSWGSTALKSFFDIDTNPAKMALMPAAAMLFLRDDMALAFNESRLRIPKDSVIDLLAKNNADIAPLWESAGITPLDALSQRLSVTFVPGKQAKKPEKPLNPPEHDADEFINKPSGKGPITWKTEGTDKPVFLGDSPSSKVMVGFLGGQNSVGSGWVVRMSETQTNFAAMTLSAVDGRPTEQSKSLLLTAVGRVENTGMQWNADRTSVGDKWGTGPTRAEGIPASVTVRTNSINATVYALDPTGKRLDKVDSQLTGGTLTFAITPGSKTIWYEIEAK